MKRLNWQIVLSLGLILFSAVLYFIHYLIFKDAYHIWYYLLNSIAFIPMEVLLVTLVIHQLLSAREKRAMLKKLNMVVGAFFSEVGNELLGKFASFDLGVEKIRPRLLITKLWGRREYFEVKKSIAKTHFAIETKKVDFKELKAFMVEKREFLLGLLENPNLLEHESFTELLWAVTHLTEELANRKELSGLPVSDLEHLTGDINRAYPLLIIQWLSYMENLGADYPYLFSLAVRLNPFDANASPIVKQ